MKRDYQKFNYCNGCALQFSKDVRFCTRCGRRVRSKSHYHPKARPSYYKYKQQ